MNQQIRRIKFAPPRPSMAAEKIVAVNQAMGNENAGKNQGTMRVIFDEIPMTVSTDNNQVYSFFDPSTVRSFPHTNLPTSKFEKNESMSIQRMSMQAVIYNQTTNNITAIYDLISELQLNVFYGGILDVYSDNNRLVKEMSLIEMMPQFNPNANFAGITSFVQSATVAGNVTTNAVNVERVGHSVLWFPTALIIPEQTQFSIKLRVPSVPVLPFSNVNIYLRMTIAGLSYINAPKVNQ